MSGEATLLQLIDVTRRFPGVTALDGVSFDLESGEVHALVGENGAGKSTLINLICGVLAPDAGSILLEGAPVEFTNPVMARRRGILAVHQETELFAPLSVAENIALNVGLPTGPSGLVRWSAIRSDARRILGRIHEPIDPAQPAGDLSVSHRQMIQVASAMLHGARVVILDEPTSSLSSVEAQWLFDEMARLKQAGVGIIYISHKQEEILKLADRVSVLRDGRHVWTKSIHEVDSAGMIRAMVGREQVAGTQKKGVPSVQATTGAQPPRLALHRFTSHDGRFKDVSLEINAGEIVGLYGLVGAGRSELAEAIFGLSAISSGEITVDGQRATIHRPDDAVSAGIALVPEDRLHQGICRGLSVQANAALASLERYARGPFIQSSHERNAAQAQIGALGVRMRSLDQPIGQLSGGNQQKVVIGRWLLTQPGVLILDEPTRGIDVGAKAEIHRLVRSLADRGAAVLLISSELPEVLEHSDRILVFRQGRVSAEFSSADADPHRIAAAALPIDGRATDHEPRPVSRSKSARWRARSELGLAVAVLVLGAVLGATHRQFLTVENLLGVLTNVSTWGILALAASVVIVCRGIDISIGSLLALSAASAGLILQSNLSTSWTIPLAVLTALAVGIGGGLLNAGVSLIGRVHPIVVTLGTMAIYRGLMMLLTGGNTIADLPSGFVGWATAPVLGINGAVLLLAGTALAASVWLGFTRTGRQIYAYGSSPSAARLVGISQRRAWLAAFGAGGLLTGLAGLLQLAQNGGMQSSLGMGYELRAIAAAVIGGTSISGGRGSVAGVLLGSLLLGLLYNALVLWQISPFRYDLVIGGLIVVAVLLDLAWRRWFG